MNLLQIICMYFNAKREIQWRHMGVTDSYERIGVLDKCLRQFYVSSQKYLPATAHYATLKAEKDPLRPTLICHVSGC